MSDDTPETLPYAAPARQRRMSALTSVALLAGLSANILFAAALFIWNGGRVWGPYLYPLVSIRYAQPLVYASMPPGLIGIFAAAIATTRHGPRRANIAAAGAAVAYWAMVVIASVTGSV